MGDLDCVRCGACCVTPTATDYVPVTALDRRRMPTKYDKKLTENVDPELMTEAPFALPLKKFPTLGYACTAFKGKVGKEARCDIYSQRPEWCRVFEKGSDECLSRRAEVGYNDVQEEGEADDRPEQAYAAV